MYTGNQNVYRAFERASSETPQPSEAVKAASKNPLSKLTDLSSLTPTEKKELLEYLKTNPISLEENKQALQQYKSELDKIENMEEIDAETREILALIKQSLQELDKDVKKNPKTSKKPKTRSPEKKPKTAPTQTPETAAPKPTMSQEKFKRLRTKYHQDFKEVWRNFNTWVDPKLKKDNFKEIKSEYSALEKKLADAKTQDDMQENIAQVSIFIGRLRPYAKKSRKETSEALDTFEAKSQPLYTLMQGTKPAESAPLRPKQTSGNTTEENQETTQNTYLERIESGIKDIVAKMEQGKGSAKQFDMIFDLMTFGADLALNEKYISKENKEILEKYKPTLDGIIGEMFLDILKKDGYTFRIEKNKKGITRMIFNHENETKSKNMTKMMNNRFESGYTWAPHKHPLFKILESGLIYDKVQEIQAKNPKLAISELKKPENFKKYFGDIIAEKSVPQTRIDSVIDSLDKKDEVELEMQNTLRTIEEQIPAYKVGAKPYVPPTERNQFIESISKPLDVIGDLTGNGIHGFVHMVHDVFKAQEGRPFQQMIVWFLMGLAILKYIVIWAFRKWGLKKILGTLVAWNAYNAYRQGKTDAFKEEAGKYWQRAQAALTANTGGTTPDEKWETTQEMIQQTTALSDAAAKELDTTLVKPLWKIAINDLAKALSASEKDQAKEWKKIMEKISDPKVKAQIQEALKDKTKKSALKNLIDTTLEHEEIKKYKKDNPDKYLTLTLEEALKMVQEKNKESNAVAKARELDDDEVFDKSLQMIDGVVHIIGPNGEPRKISYNEMTPEAQEMLKNFGKNETKARYYGWVVQALNVPSITSAYASGLVDMREGNITAKDFFQSMDVAFIDDGTKNTEVDTEEMEKLIATLGESDGKDISYDVIAFIKEEVRVWYHLAGRLLADKLVPAADFQAQAKKLFDGSDYQTAITKLDLSEDQKEELRDQLKSMQEYANSREYNDQLEEIIGGSYDGLTEEQKKERAEQKKAQSDALIERSMAQALKYVMAQKIAEDKSYPFDKKREGELFRDLEWIGLTNFADRNAAWWRLILEQAAWEVVAVGAGIFTGSLGFWGINAMRATRVWVWLARLGRAGKYAGTATRVVWEWLAFHFGYQGVKLATDEDATIGNTIGDVRSMAESIAFIGAGRALSKLYNMKWLKWLRKTEWKNWIWRVGHGALNIGRWGLKLTINTAVYGAALSPVEVVFSKWDWTDEALMKAFQMAIIGSLLHGTKRAVFKKTNKTVKLKDGSETEVKEVITMRTPKEFADYGKAKDWKLSKFVGKLEWDSKLKGAGRILVWDIVEVFAKDRNLLTSLWHAVRNNLSFFWTATAAWALLDDDDFNPKNPDAYGKILMILATGPWRAVFWWTLYDTLSKDPETNTLPDIVKSTWNAIKITN